MKNGSKRSSSSSSSSKPNGLDLKKDRKSGSGLIGSPKKGGHGGKFTWAGDGYSSVELNRAQIEPVDNKDPNFEDPQDVVIAH